MKTQLAIISLLVLTTAPAIALSPEDAMLNTIVWAEAQYGAKCQNLPAHPQVIRSIKRVSTDVAGCFSFLSSSWNVAAKQLGLKDFSIANQRKAARYYLQQSGAIATLKSGPINQQRFTKAASQVGNYWVSFPNPYGQEHLPIPQLWNKFQSELEK